MRYRTPLQTLLALLAALALSLGGAAAVLTGCEDPREEALEEETGVEIEDEDELFEENELGEEGLIDDNERLGTEDELFDPEYGEQEPVEMIEE